MRAGSTTSASPCATWRPRRSSTSLLTAGRSCTRRPSRSRASTRSRSRSARAARRAPRAHRRRHAGRPVPREARRGDAPRGLRGGRRRQPVERLRAAGLTLIDAAPRAGPVRPPGRVRPPRQRARRALRARAAPGSLRGSRRTRRRCGRAGQVRSRVRGRRLGDGHGAPGAEWGAPREGAAGRRRRRRCSGSSVQDGVLLVRAVRRSRTRGATRASAASASDGPRRRPMDLDAAILHAAARLRTPARRPRRGRVSSLGDYGVGWVAAGGAVAAARRLGATRWSRRPGVVWGRSPRTTASSASSAARGRRATTCRRR